MTRAEIERRMNINGLPYDKKNYKRDQDYNDPNEIPKDVPIKG